MYNPDIRYNVAVIGKTGVGKSSLINYIFDEDVREVGTGKPVTSQNFEATDLNLSNIKARIFDSKGLEADKSEQWLLELRKELYSRSVRKPIKKWFHTIFYCINSGSKRVEDFEIKVIKELLQKKNSVILIFTKAYMADKKEINKMYDTINKEIEQDLDYIAVCSEEKTLIGGRKVEKYGKEQIFQSIYRSFWSTFINKLPLRIQYLFHSEIDSWYEEMKEYIDNNLKMFGTKKFIKRFESKIEKYIKKLDKKILPKIISEEIEHFFNSYSAITKFLNYHLKDFSNFIPEYEELIDILNNDSKIKDEASNLFKSGLVFAVGGGILKKAGLLLGLSKFSVLIPPTYLIYKYFKRNKLMKKLKKDLLEIKNELEKAYKEEVLPELNGILTGIKDMYLNKRISQECDF